MKTTKPTLKTRAEAALRILSPHAPLHVRIIRQYIQSLKPGK